MRSAWAGRGALGSLCGGSVMPGVNQEDEGLGQIAKAGHDFWDTWAQRAVDIRHVASVHTSYNTELRQDPRLIIKKSRGYDVGAILIPGYWDSASALQHKKKKLHSENQLIC